MAYRAVGRLGDAVLYLGTDDSSLKRGLDDAEARTSTWGSMLQGVMAGVGIAVADMAMDTVRTAVNTIGESISAASDLSETISKTGEIFGGATDDVLAWSEQTAAAIGQSQQAALDGAATFGIFGKAAGLTGADLTAFSTELVNLGSDLASFNNTSPEQAVQALGAALRGESEPLRAYGVLLDDATLRAAAFELGLTESNTAALTAQQRILAAQKVIFEQTQTQQGDFARTSDGLANSQRTLAAQWENFRANIGSLFLPVVETATNALNTLAQTVLPPLQRVMDNTVGPAIGRLSEQFAVFIDGKGAELGEWLVGMVGGFGEFVGGLTTMDRETEIRTGSMAGKFLAMYESVSQVFASFDALFSAGDAGDNIYSPGLAGLLEIITQLSGEISGVIELFLLMGDAAKKVLGGDWSGLQDMSQDFWDAAWRAGVPVDPSRVSPDLRDDPTYLRQRGIAPSAYGEPDVTYHNYLPITINAPGGDPAAVQQATLQGVNQALAARGMLP